MTQLADRAFAALQRGDPAARAHFAAAIADAPENAALYIGDAEARFAAGDQAPWLTLDPLLAAHPDWVEGQSIRAALRWECGAGDSFADGFRAAIAALPTHAGLWNAYIGVLTGAGDYTGAADAARDAQAIFDVPALRLIEASNAGTAGDLTRASLLLDSLPSDLPGRGNVEVRHYLRTGRADGAEDILARQRAADPNDLSAWALTDLAWRMLGDDRASWLGGQEGLIGTIELDLPDAEIAALASTLRGLHRQRAQPIGQSVRGGTQTRGPLFELANPHVRRLHRAIQAGVGAYVAGLPSRDDSHPLLRHRDRPIVAQGGWSVRLRGAGFHVPHLHPAGILSSACYIAVPPLDAAAREGWLELGAPPRDLLLDLPSRATIEPKPGRLALFPSYLYHGTRPFGEGERLTVAFDAV